MLKTLGKYELIAEAGRGAMGEVYKARDPFIGRLVALKTITSGLANRPDLLERFYQEARSAGTLQHPSIVTIYELGKEGDIPFIAMEYLEGPSLEKVIEHRTALPLFQKLSYIVPVCRALDYAHKRRIIHRDIKPGNVMLTKEGSVKVVDFGIARVMDASNTQTNMLIGTLGYMSPQQIQGERADERSDIWAVGVMFYELLCYQRPFDGSNQAALMMNIISEKKQPTSIQDLVPECPPEVQILIEKMLQKEIDRRFQSMEEVLSDLEPLWKRLQEETISESIARGENLVSARDFLGAQDVLRKALHIDSSHARARKLLDKVNLEIKRSHVLQDIQLRAEKAQSLLQEGRFQEARAEAEAALKLDSSIGTKHEALAEVRRLLERARLVEEHFQASKQSLAGGALTEAGLEIEAALELEADQPQLRALQKQIQDQLARREERRRLSAVLQDAQKHWTERRYDECIVLLTDIQQDFPNEQEISKLLETARHDQIEQQKQQQLAEARALLTTQQFDDALTILSALEKQHPGDQGIQNLQAFSLRAQMEFTRQKRFRVEMENLRALANTSQFSDLISRGEKLLAEYTRETDLVDLVEFARAEEEKRHFLDSILQTVREKIDTREFRVAIATAEKGLSRFPHHVELSILLAEGRRLAEKARKVEEYVQNCRQLLAAGALTEARQEIEKALELQGSARELQALQKQVQDQLVRQKERERLSAALYEGRKYWAEQQYDECIAFLTRIQKEFPQDPEIATLLETATHDRAQQQKQQELAEARNLLGAQRFHDALAILDALVERFSNDRAVQNLKSLILQSQKDFTRHQRVLAEMGALRDLINAKKFPDVIFRGEKLLSEFPQESELAELVEFARAEEQKRKLDSILKEIGEKMTASDFQGAMLIAEKGLKQFPRDVQLSRLSEEARANQREKEKRALREKRVTEIRGKISSGLLTDAVDMARQTLSTIGSDTDVTQLLYLAEMELAEKRQKEADREDRVKTARTLVDSGRLDDATQLLKRAIATQIFAPDDPRINDLLTQIFDKKSSTQLEPQLDPPPPTPAKWPAVTGEPARDYVYERGLPQPPTSPVDKVGTEAPSIAFSATMAISPNAAAGNASATAPPEIEQPVPETKLQISKPAEFSAPSQRSAFDLPLAPRPSVSVALEELTTPVSKSPLRKSSKNLVYAGIGICVLIVVILVFRPKYPQARPDVPRPVEIPFVPNEPTKGPGNAILTAEKKPTTEALPKSNPNPNPKVSVSQPMEASKSGPNTPVSAPDYGPVIGSIQSLISQGRWDEANDKLSDIPLSLQQYPQLKSQIEGGRREDKDFSSRKDELTKAELDKNQSSLRDLREFFGIKANQAGRLGNEAQEIVSRIDRDMNDIVESKRPSVSSQVNQPPVPLPIGGNVVPSPIPSSTSLPPAPVTLSVTDALAIQSVLQKYAQAVTDASVDEVKIVRQLNRDEEKKLSGSLNATKGLGFSLQNCSSPKIDGDSAQVSCQTALARMKDARSAQINFSLSKINGRWMIVRTD